MHRRTSPKVVANTNTRMALTPGQSHGAPRGRARLALILARLVAKKPRREGRNNRRSGGLWGGSAGYARQVGTAYTASQTHSRKKAPLGRFFYFFKRILRAAAEVMSGCSAKR